jgi:hypothetical protein
MHQIQLTAPVIAALVVAVPPLLTFIITFVRDSQAISRRWRALDRAQKLAEFAKLYGDAIAAGAQSQVGELARETIERLLAAAADEALLSLKQQRNRVSVPAISRLRIKPWPSSTRGRVFAVLYYLAVVTVLVSIVLTISIIARTRHLPSLLTGVAFVLDVFIYSFYAWFFRQKVAKSEIRDLGKP